MTMAVPYASGLSFGFDKRDAVLWSGAAALVVAAHTAVGWYAYSRPADSFDANPPTSAVMIDLAPMAVAPMAVPLDEAELVDSAASEAVEPVEEAPPETMEAETSETEPVEPSVAEAAVSEPLPEAAAEPVEREESAEIVPDLVEVPLPEIAMAVPQPRPKVSKPVPAKQHKPVEKPVAKPVKKVVRKPPPSAAMRKSAERAPRTAAPAPSAGSGRSISPARWQARVNAHLNRYKRFPAGARARGIATVQFTINPSGAVTGASLASSSGDSALDIAAVALVRRASPVPAPPPEIASAAMRLAVPIQFSR